MSIKRLLPLLIVVSVGFLTLSAHFINNNTIDTFVREDATGWYNIIAAFAVFLGSLNLIKFQSSKIIYKKTDWQYSILTLLGFFIMVFFAFFLRGTPKAEEYIDSNNNVYDPQDILDNKINPTVIAKWKKNNNDSYYIPAYSK